MAPKMAFFTGFGPRRAAGLAEQPNFFFAIVIWHLNEHSVRVSALNSKIFLMATPFWVVSFVYQIVHLSKRPFYFVHFRISINTINYIIQHNFVY